jgi:phytoene synthase
MTREIRVDTSASLPLTISSEALARSYAHCMSVAKREAKNFYYSFTVLPREKKAAMCAIYAFMRYSDDISDEAALSSSKHDLLPRWRAALDRAFEGDYGDSQILPAFHDVTRKYAIPKRFFHDLIDGTEMDLTKTRYETFEELYQYCYRVASIVGLVCIHVWGFEGGEEAYVPAEACGIGFQLTNILRDLKEDAERGRIYLPQEDLRRFDYSEEDLRQGVIDARFKALMQFQVERAHDHYERSLPLIPMLSTEGKPAFISMYRIYRGVLEQIEAQNYDVFTERARLSKAKKISIMAQAWLGSRLPGGSSFLKV